MMALTQFPVLMKVAVCDLPGKGLAAPPAGRACTQLSDRIAGSDGNGVHDVQG